MTQSDDTRSLFLASPAHDGRVDTAFLCASIDTDRLFRSLGIPLRFYFNLGESLVQRARNNIAKVFLQSVCTETGQPYTHLLMIDTDLGFRAKHVQHVMELCDDEHPIVAGMAPLKTIDWSAVGVAARMGASDDDLRWAGSRNVVNALDGYDYATDEGPLLPVKYAGTGFMCIRRDALVRFVEAYPELAYLPDYTIGSPEFDLAADRRVTAFFDTIICPDEQRYLSEDYTFCKRARAIGLNIYVARNVLLEHIGKYSYQPNRGRL